MCVGLWSRGLAAIILAVFNNLIVCLHAYVWCVGWLDVVVDDGGAGWLVMAVAWQ